MKKTIAVLGGLTALYIGFVALTGEACACVKPSAAIRLNLSFVVENIKKSNTDFTNICNTPNLKQFSKDLAEKYEIDVKCASNKEDFALQTRLPNKIAFCIDKDSQREEMLIKEGAVSCE